MSKQEMVPEEAEATLLETMHDETKPSVSNQPEEEQLPSTSNGSGSTTGQEALESVDLFLY
jgi:hypothetical protein